MFGRLHRVLTHSMGTGCTVLTMNAWLAMPAASTTASGSMGGTWTTVVLVTLMVGAGGVTTGGPTWAKKVRTLARIRTIVADRSKALAPPLQSISLNRAHHRNRIVRE